MTLQEGKSWAVLPVRIIVCTAAILISTVTHADSVDVYWSGFAYQGDFCAEVSECPYPHSKSLSDRKVSSDSVVSVLDERLNQKLEGVRNDTFNIVFDELGSIGPDASSSIALAFVLDRETVSVEQIGENYKILISLSAQALFFDFDEMAVVSTYPVSLIYIDVKKSEPTDEDKAALVEQLYLGSLKVNVFDEFVKTLSAAKLNTLVRRRIQVTEVSVDSAVAENLPAFWQQHPEDFLAFLSQQFGRSLSENQDVPILPFTKGYAIGNRMSLRFDDQSVFSLTLPEPDYVVSLALKKLVKVEYAKVAAGTSYVYGTFLAVKAQEPLSGRVYLDTTVKNGAVKTVPAAQKNVDDWPAYQDSLLDLINKFTSILSAPTKEWAKKHVGDGAMHKQLSSFGKVVLSCR